MFALLLIPLFAAADRLWGAARPAFKGKKAVISAAVLGAGFLVGDWLFAALGLLWLVYRSLPFKGGAGAPTTTAERKRAFVRHFLIVPLPIFLAVAAGGSPLVMAVAMVGYVSAAYLLAIWYGLEVLDAVEDGVGIGDQNRTVEIARGAAYGLALAAYALA